MDNYQAQVTQLLLEAKAFCPGQLQRKITDLTQNLNTLPLCDLKRGDHTPGPWSWDRSRHPDLQNKSVNIFDSDGCILANVRLAQTLVSEFEANANLITAAPELMDSLHELVLYITTDFYHEYKQAHLIKEAQKALNKAKGVQS